LFFGYYFATINTQKRYIEKAIIKTILESSIIYKRQRKGPEYRGLVN